MTMLARIGRFFRDQRGQNLLEYGLMMGFLALAAAGFFLASGQGASRVWTNANTVVTAALDATQSPSAGDDESRDHDPSGHAYGHDRD